MENWTWKNEIWSGVRITPKNKRFKIDIDFRFWANIPALNINLHSLELENISHSFVGVKVYVPGSSLERAYEIARPFMEAVKKKYFKKKSKCPFGFMRRKDD